MSGEDQAFLVFFVIISWFLLGLITAVVLQAKDDPDAKATVSRENLAAGLLFWPLLWVIGLLRGFFALLDLFGDLVVMAWKRVWR